MLILYLRGWHSVGGGVKPTFLRAHGHEVIDPDLDDDDFERSLATAQAAYERRRPDLVVGSSRGGAVAVNLRAPGTRLVLICPAWKTWGTARTVPPGTLILHAPADDVVPFSDSVELVSQSGLAPEALLAVGTDHRLADPEPLARLLRAVEQGC